jgi:beta-lactamase superfamily II metal-dependent hydrolase/pimeloyl-ACP methyl ester carboxylesterase
MLFDGIIASAIVWLAALPLVALRFHIISPIGILLNIPLIPITSAAMLFGGFGLAVSALSSTAASLFTGIAGLLLRWTQAIVVWGVNQDWGHRFVAGPSPQWVTLFYIILAIATFSIARMPKAKNRAAAQLQPAPTTIIPNRRPRPSALFASLGLLAIWPVPGWIWTTQAQPLATPQVDFLAVGHGLAIVIRTPENQTYLYDCGRMGDPSVGRRVIAPALWSLGLTHIDQVFLSHADQDHYDGLPDLLDRFTIGRVRIPPGFGGLANPDALKLLEQIGRKGIPIEPIAAPDSWQSGQTHFHVLHPPRGWNPDASDNAHSLTLDIAYNGRHLLLTGDLEQEGMLDLVGEPFPDPPPEVVLAPHHGGRAANPDWFYDWTNPRTIVVSQRSLPPGANDALAPIEQRGIPLLRTWRDGAIRATWTTSGILTQTHILPPVTPPTPPPATPQIPWLTIAIALLSVLAGLLTFAALAVIEIGARTLIFPPRRKPGNEPSTDAATTRTAPLAEPLTATTPAGTKLSARWYRAQGAKPTGRTILLLHGFAEPTTAWESARAPVLSHDGWNVAAIDARGYGNTQPHLSSFGVHEAEDLRVWIDLLRTNHSKHDPSKPFTPVLWGRSMGSITALRTAAADPSIAGLILESPLADVVATVTTVLRARRLPFPRLLARLMLLRAGSKVKANLIHPTPTELAAQIARPTLIIHGENDRLIPIPQAQHLAAAFPTPPRWITVPAAGHSNVITIGGESLLAEIVEFLDETF